MDGVNGGKMWHPLETASEGQAGGGDTGRTLMCVVLCVCAHVPVTLEKLARPY